MEQRYLTLVDFELKKLCLKQKKFIKLYIKEKRCKCIDKVLPNHILNCKHLRDAMKKEFRKEELQAWNHIIDAVVDDLENMNINPDKLRVPQ